MPFGRSPSSLNRGWSTVLVVASSTVFRYPEPRPIPGSGVLLVLVVDLCLSRNGLAGSQSSAGGCGGRRAIGQTGNFRFWSRLSLLLAGWCRNLCRTRIRTAPHCLSLSPTGRSGSRQYRDDQSGWSRRPLVCTVSNCRRTRSEADVYHTLMVHSTAGDSVRRSSSSWAFAGPSDGSCPWEQRDNHSRTGTRC